MNYIDLVKDIIDRDQSDWAIRNYLYPKLYTMLVDGDFNDGRYDMMKPVNEVLVIDRYECRANLDVAVYVNILQRTNDFDHFWVTRSKEEWDNVKDYVGADGKLLVWSGGDKIKDYVIFHGKKPYRQQVIWAKTKNDENI
jgi:hypothetical protein